jgi:hypothetical protein
LGRRRRPLLLRYSICCIVPYGIATIPAPYDPILVPAFLSVVAYHCDKAKTVCLEEVCLTLSYVHCCTFFRLAGAPMEMILLPCVEWPSPWLCSTANCSYLPGKSSIAQHLHHNKHQSSLSSKQRSPTTPLLSLTFLLH